MFFDLHAKVDKTNKKYKKHAKLFNHGAWRDHSGVRPGEIILERGLEGSFSVDHFVVGLGGIILGGLILGCGLKGAFWELGGGILDRILEE